MGRFEVWIICTRGTGHNWRKMSTFGNRSDAEEFVSWHKEIDAKFPKGHYSYKIETVPMKERKNMGKNTPADILCEFCDAELTLETAVSNHYGNCCSQCNRKVEDFVCTETGESTVMFQIAELVTAYGDASYDCGALSGIEYQGCLEKLRDARKTLMRFLHEVAQK